MKLLHSFLAPGPEASILETEFVTLMNDLSVDVEGRVPYIIQWKFKAAPLGRLSKDQFITGCRALGFIKHFSFLFLTPSLIAWISFRIDDIPSFKRAIPRMEAELRDPKVVCLSFTCWIIIVF